MAISILGPLNEVINKTATEIIDNQIPGKIAGVINTFTSACFTVVDDLFKKVQDLTKQEQP